ncbi:MAG: hypothetical protein IH878_04265 [Gemmatimonadetes bacterium]|nr:hypothetical protein [Gemmatimonadota bacterium]
MKVAISIPSHSTWMAGFGVDLVALVLKRRLQKPLIELHHVVGAPHVLARSGLVEGALETGASHMLWLDCDMRFPPDTLTRLLAHKKPIVGANAVARNDPHTFVATRGGKIVRTTGDSHGLEAVDKVGLAVMLTSMEVFRKIPRPWFLFEYVGNKNYMSEDVYFCRKAKKAGFEIYVDHDLSKKVCHTAALDLPWYMGLSEEELDEAQIMTPQQEPDPKAAL